MNPDEYIKQRLVDQVDWYDRKSQSAQSTFRWLRGLEIVSAAAIPFLAGFSDRYWAVPIVGFLGASIVVLAAFQSLGQYHENSLEYRTTCESLKHEKFLFLTQAAPYNSDTAFALLVERVESLLSKEHSAWAQHTRSGVQSSKVNGQTE